MKKYKWYVMSSSPINKFFKGRYISTMKEIETLIVKNKFYITALEK